jgi:monothiol glutaredoxin
VIDSSLNGKFVLGCFHSLSSVFVFFGFSGFSNNAVRILETLTVPFETVNVLEDPAIRQGIKDYSKWPTIPQLYIKGEFIGGTDIMIDLYNSGELEKLVKDGTQ